MGTPDVPGMVTPFPKFHVIGAPVGLGVIPVNVNELQLLRTTLVICGLFTSGQQTFFTAKFKYRIQLPYVTTT